MMSSAPIKLFKIIDSQWNYERNKYNFVVITVRVNGLAPLGTTASAGTRMDTVKSLI